VHIATLDSCATAMVRLSSFDSPQAVAGQMETFMKAYLPEVRKTVEAIDFKVIKRARGVWAKDPEFVLDLARYQNPPVAVS
jgi:hypothetical protein